MNLATNLEQSAFFFPDRPAISSGETELTYAQLNDRANRIATALININVRPGDMVALFAPNSPDWVAFYFGVLKTGAVAVTLSSVLMPDEMNLLLNHARPKVVFTEDEKLDDFEPFLQSGWLKHLISPESDMNLDRLMSMGSGDFSAMDRDRTDTAVVLYTGGTTGIPKGVMLSHENINVAIQNVRFHERSNEMDRVLLFLPLNHIFGQMHIMNATLLSAGCLEMIPAFDLERVLELTSKNRVTRFYAVPTIYVRLLTVNGLKEKLGKLRYCFSAASSMPEEVVRQWKTRTGLSIYESYGMTEAAPMATYNHFHRHVVGSVGTAVPGMEIQIRDKNGCRLEQGEKGEICLRGRNIMKRYLNNPEATKEVFWDRGWFRSGDVGIIDKNGYVYIVDRIKDVIITGGENVYPREVEEVLYTRPEVQECAVVGLPDPEWGERVTAYIVLQPGKTIDKDIMKVFLKNHLSPFKIPKEYLIVESFPKSATGKILKRELRGNVSTKKGFKS